MSNRKSLHKKNDGFVPQYGYGNNNRGIGNNNVGSGNNNVGIGGGYDEDEDEREEREEEAAGFDDDEPVPKDPKLETLDKWTHLRGPYDEEQAIDFLIAHPEFTSIQDIEKYAVQLGVAATAINAANKELINWMGGKLKNKAPNHKQLIELLISKQAVRVGPFDTIGNLDTAITGIGGVPVAHNASQNFIIQWLGVTIHTLNPTPRNLIDFLIAQHANVLLNTVDRVNNAIFAAIGYRIDLVVADHQPEIVLWLGVTLHTNAPTKKQIIDYFLANVADHDSIEELIIRIDTLLGAPLALVYTDPEKILINWLVKTVNALVPDKNLSASFLLDNSTHFRDIAVVNALIIAGDIGGTAFAFADQEEIIVNWLATKIKTLIPTDRQAYKFIENAGAGAGVADIASLHTQVTAVGGTYVNPGGIRETVLNWLAKQFGKKPTLLECTNEVARGTSIVNGRNANDVFAQVNEIWGLVKDGKKHSKSKKRRSRSRRKSRSKSRRRSIKRKSDGKRKRSRSRRKSRSKSRRRSIKRKSDGKRKQYRSRSKKRSNKRKSNRKVMKI